MKKLMIAFVFIFPIAIFVILNLFASAIAMFVPIAVTGVRLDYANKKVSLSQGQTHQLSYTVLPEFAQNKQVEFFIDDNGDGIISIDSEGKVTVHKEGYAQVTVKTIDGNYTDTCTVVAGQETGNEIKAVYLSYKTRIHSNFKFGLENSVQLNYDYFPSTAIDDLDFVSNNTVVVNKQTRTLTIFFNSIGVNELKAISRSTSVSTSFTFNVFDGYNVTNSQDTATIQGYLNEHKNIYLLEDIHATEVISLKYNQVTNQGTNIYGNGWKWNHSKLKYYDLPAKDSSYASTTNIQAISLQSKCGLYDLRVTGKVTNQNMLYSRVINVGMSGKNDFTNYNPDQEPFDDDIIIKNCIIENGRYNITTFGGYNLKIYDTTTRGAALASIQVNNPTAPGSKVNTTILNIRDWTVDLCPTAMILENSSTSLEGVKGYSVVNILPSDTPEKTSVSANSNWRNIDEANTSEMSSTNSGTILSSMVNQNRDIVIEKDGYFYVNCFAVIMGGRPNHSQLVISDPVLTQSLKQIEYTPATTEGMILGGRSPFNLYCFYAP